MLSTYQLNLPDRVTTILFEGTHLCVSFAEFIVLVRVTLGCLCLSSSPEMRTNRAMNDAERDSIIQLVDAHKNLETIDGHIMTRSDTGQDSGM